MLCGEHSLPNAQRVHGDNPLRHIEVCWSKSSRIPRLGPIGRIATGIAVLKERGHVEMDQCHYSVAVVLPCQLLRCRDWNLNLL